MNRQEAITLLQAAGYEPVILGVRGTAYRRDDRSFTLGPDGARIEADLTYEELRRVLLPELPREMPTRSQGYEATETGVHQHGI
ncbi:MAG TPA: hypothetical protein VGK74_02275 [Symbiobacteriaceae bacterium]|jgi:hypothetical protein